MKKTILTVALATISLLASAQTLNVQSAAQHLKQGYLDKAKKEIDLACAHENTKDDAKTWYYAGLIYTRIGSETTNPKSKYKALDADWCEKALNAAMRCKELDKSNEFADNNNSVFRYVGNDYYGRAVNAFNDDKNYTGAMELVDKAIMIFNNSGDKKFASDAYYLGGLAARASRDTAAIFKYFKPLVRSRSDKQVVYQTLFEINLAQHDTAEATKVAANYVKSCPKDYNSYMLMATADFLKGNIEKGNESINKALEQAKDNTAVYAELLCKAAAALESAKNYDGAEAKYKESLTLVPNQFAANYYMGIMIFNRAADKIEAAGQVPFDDETGLYDKLMEESKDFYRQSLPYLKASISYLDGLTDQNAIAQNRNNLYQNLKVLKMVYTKLEMLDDLKPINARIAQIESAQ